MTFMSEFTVLLMVLNAKNEKGLNYKSNSDTAKYAVAIRVMYGIIEGTTFLPINVTLVGKKINLCQHIDMRKF